LIPATVIEADPVLGTFELETAETKGASWVKLCVNMREIKLPDVDCIDEAPPAFRQILATIQESEIQSLDRALLPSIRILVETSETAEERPITVTRADPVDGKRENLTLEIRLFM